MKELARLYIEKRIQKIKNNGADSITKLLSKYSGKSQAEHAREEAQIGFPATTAK